MHHDIEVLAEPDAVARAAATYVADRARAAVAGHGGFTFAVSGGHTPWAMFGHLSKLAMPWDKTILFQVDERMTAIDDPDRNVANLIASLAGAPAQVRAMPVEDPDLVAASARYAAGLPDRFDLVHLGLGPDGHTASLVPGDAVLSITDRLVAPTEHHYQGKRRMTLTYPALARADQLLWLVTGAEKRYALARLLAGDSSIPAGRVNAKASHILADLAASGG